MLEYKNVLIDPILHFSKALFSNMWLCRKSLHLIEKRAANPSWERLGAEAGSRAFTITINYTI
jgi:hypothetical protein